MGDSLDFPEKYSVKRRGWVIVWKESVTAFLRKQPIFIFFLLNMVPFNQSGVICNINISAQNIFTFHQKI